MFVNTPRWATVRTFMVSPRRFGESASIDMTRMHDGSFTSLLHLKNAVQDAGLADRTGETACATPSGGDKPRCRDVVVSYEQFKQRRQLRLRVIAAFEKLERARTLDGESRGVTDVQPPTTGDETS
jgi:hypothetical protein